MGKRLALFLNNFHLLQSFFGLKMQKSTFCKKKMVLRVVFFIKLTFRWLQTGLSDRKNTKQLKLYLWWIFYSFSKFCIFQFFFEIFEIHQYFMVKLLNALNFI